MPVTRFRAPSPVDSDTSFDVGPPTSAGPVAIAAVLILAAGLAGLYRGVVSVREVTAGAKAGPTTSAIVGATPAVALPPNPEWSTLSGPQVLPPPSAKPPKVQDEADSDEGDSEASQAAEAVGAPAEPPASPAPAPAPRPAPPAVTPAPVPQGA